VLTIRSMPTSPGSRPSRLLLRLAVG